MAAIEIRGLEKRYSGLRGSQLAVAGLDLDVEAGGVFGFLGPNGAGKTTTIRCLLGLVRPTKGEIRVLGATVPDGFASVRQRVGAIVETPKFFPSFSGRRNLQMLARTKGVGLGDVDELLGVVGLADRAGDKFKSYSLGMKQRLAVAATLLGEPELLILDEPANGLDPAGISAMRDLVRGLGAQGRTVLVSSHQLSDIERMCDRVAIIRNGRLIRTGSVEELMRTGASGRVSVRIDDPAGAAAVLQQAGMQVSPGPDGASLLVDGVTDAAAITYYLAQAGRYLRDLRPDRASLEDVFLQLTGEPDPEAPPRFDGPMDSTTHIGPHG